LQTREELMEHEGSLLESSASDTQFTLSGFGKITISLTIHLLSQL